MCESKMMVAGDLFVENYPDFPFYDWIILQWQRQLNINYQFWWLR